MHIHPSLLMVVGSALPTTFAWGTVGHATVGAIGDHYLNAGAKSWVQSILGAGVTMESVASWADTFRYTTAGRFSAPYHFIDAEDSPPSSCSVDFDRDCGSGGCVVGAIANYTDRVQDGNLSAEDQFEALKFLVHFIGDITQPLHDEAEEVGGNDIKVTWDGASTNLHACWDTQMVEKIAGGKNSTAVVADFAESLISQIDSGSYSSESSSWISCVDITQAESCALQWAQDANAINCQYVLVNDENGQELDGDYFNGASPYIQQQIAKAGYRLGAYINNLAAAQ